MTGVTGYIQMRWSAISNFFTNKEHGSLILFTSNHYNSMHMIQPPSSAERTHLQRPRQLPNFIAFAHPKEADQR